MRFHDLAFEKEPYGGIGRRTGRYYSPDITGPPEMNLVARQLYETAGTGVPTSGLTLGA